MKKITLLFIIFTLLGCSTDNNVPDKVSESAPAPAAVTLSADPTSVTAGGTATATVTANVIEPVSAPTVTLSADPTSITAGSSSTLTWASTNADTVSIDNGIGTVAASGTSTVSPSATTTYTITAQGPGGTASDTAVVDVSPADAPAISISAASESIALGTSTMLSWQSSNVDNVYIDNGIGPVALTGSQSVTPEHTTIYTITGSGSKGTISAQVTVQVTGSPEPQPEGSFGDQYDDLVPEDATVAKYDEKRFALITGVVHNLAGSPLADVRITVHGHPEYGTVLTDTEGRFSIPVEGGGTMTLAYRHEGFITSHRQVSVPWNDIAIAETVQMAAEDPVATTVTFDGNPATVITHTSTEVSDDFGSRSATMVFQGDNKAYLLDEQGNTVQELSNITTRATEFATQKSMPAVLPPNSAYTYCAELSVDGAARVRFEKPITVWVDNFLGFAVGDAVPVGYYDRDRGVWVPSENGVVVKLLDTDSDGVVDALDSTGDDAPDDLNNDGSFADEVTGLGDASRYAPGATFWRTAVTHFTPWDCNWPYGPKEDAIPPNGKGTPDAEGAETTDGKKPDDTDCINSYVKKRGRVFHEDIPIPGTGMTLHYASNRVDGYEQVITVPASGDTVPESLKSIIVEVKLAGRTLTQTLEPLANQQAQFVWDGLDYLGRETGTVDADVTIGFVYDAVYLTAGNFANAFAQAGSDVTGIRARQEVISWQRFELEVGVEKAAGNIAEGWTLSAHHLLGRRAAHLYKGNGSSLENKNSSIITTLAGTGSSGYNGDDIPAAEAELDHPDDVTVDQFGNIFIADRNNHRIRKVDTNGIITTVAGTGSSGYNDDNIPAIEAEISYPDDVVVDQLGNIFIADTGNNRIRKVDTNGIITTVAGNGSEGDGGDGGPAIEAELEEPYEVAVDEIGNIFIVNVIGYYNDSIRKVDTNGIITTVAGGGSSTQDNIPAVQAKIRAAGVIVDQAGNFLIADSRHDRVRKVDSSGIITTVAGTGLSGYSGDGGPAIEARLNTPTDIAFDQAGNLFICDEDNFRIRKIDPNGIITTVAGNGSSGYAGDGGPAIEASLDDPLEVAVDQLGNIFMAEYEHHRIRKVEFASAVFKSDLLTTGDIPFADPNGLGYIMFATGLHKKTIDLDSGLVLQEFGYDADDNLISITDQFGNAITIERGADGTPTAIISPDGLRTELHINDKQLTQIVYPDSTAYKFTYSSDSLMTFEEEPNGNLFKHVFDENGKLVEVTDEEGGIWQYTRKRLNNGDVRIDSLTAEGNRTTNLDNTASTGAFSTTTIDPSGNESTFSRSADGLSQERELSCGMSSSTAYGLDPEYKYKVVRSTSTKSPAGLTKIVQIDKTYQDTEADEDELPDLITETVSSDGRTTTLVHNTRLAEKKVTTPEGRTVTSKYDPTTLLTKSVEIPGLFPSSYTYDGKGRMTSVTTENRTASLSYTGQGFLESQTDPEGRITSYNHDAVGRVTKITRPDSSTVRFSYDNNGNMTVLTNPSATDHLFDYNKVNKQNAYKTPMSGLYSSIYDKDRRLKQTNFPSGLQIKNIYTDNLLTQVQTPEGDIDYSYLCSSKIGSITKGSESLSYDYDGSLLTSETKSGTLNQALGFVYNDDFNLFSISYAGGTEEFRYDNDGLLINAGAYTLTRNTDNGLPEQVKGNALSRSRTFNGFGELTAEESTVNSQPVTNWSVTRNNNGRILTKTETVNGSTVAYAYTYDNMGRLLTVKKDGTLVEKYQYGLNGSRTYEMNSLKGEAGRDYSYSVEDHLLSAGGVSYEFDTDGFLVSKTKGGDVSGYNYSSRGELLKVTLPGGDSIEYLHDPLGRRIAKKVNGTIVEKYLWLGLTQLLAVYDGNDSLLQRFEYADGRMPVAMTAGGATYYLGYDQVGSLRTVSDTSGSVVKEISYDSFGTILSDSNPAFAVPFGFAGGLHDRDTGLVKFGFRDYDPAIGRWVAKDPIFFAGGDVDLYGYVLGDPVNFIDPDGKILNAVTAGAGAIFGATFGAAASIASQWADNPDASINWGAVAESAFSGLVGGAITGATLGLGTAVVAGVGGGAVTGGIWGTFFKDNSNSVHWPWEDDGYYNPPAYDNENNSRVGCVPAR